MTVVDNFYDKPNEMITNEPEHEGDVISGNAEHFFIGADLQKSGKIDLFSVIC